MWLTAKPKLSAWSKRSSSRKLRVVKSLCSVHSFLQIVFHYDDRRLFNNKKSLIFALFEKKHYFCKQNVNYMDKPQPQPQLHPYQAALQRQVEKTGVIVDCYEPAFPASMCGQDYILQNIYVLITHRGVAHTQYDMREFTLTPNMIVFIQPGHVIRLIDRSDDYTFSRLVLSPQIYNEMQFNTLTHSAANFHTMPVFMLSNEQKNNLMHLMEILAVITRHSTRDLAHHHQVLLAQLAVGYEFLNHYRNALNYKWTDSRKKNLANRFYNLVVAHYRESREVKYYAELLHLSPKYFSKVFQHHGYASCAHLCTVAVYADDTALPLGLFLHLTGEEELAVL